MPNIPAAGKNTEVVRGAKRCASFVVDFLYSARARLDILADSNLPALVIRDEVYRRGLADARKRGVRIRILTEVIADNIAHCKDLTELCELRHMEGIKANFGVSEFEYLATGAIPIAQPISQVIYNNAREMVEQQEYVFESFWDRAIPARTRISEIEEGRESPITEVIENPERSLALGAEMMRNAKEEVLLILSTPDIFQNAIKMGQTETYRGKLAKGILLRMLVPDDDQTRRTVDNLRATSNVEFSYIDKSLQTGMSLLLVDRKELMVWETTDDSYEAMGRATYSNSSSLVLSLYQIYRILWTQTELYENIKLHNRMQSEFVNIAAHEIRTPVQPILGMADIIEAQFNGEDTVAVTKEDMALIIRNARRLERLTTDILEVTRIESGSIKLHREALDMNVKIQNVARDAKETIPAGVELRLEPAPEPVIVDADKSRMYEVVSNLLSNAIKFTSKGSIVISVERVKHDGADHALVTVRDTGAGIDPEIMPRLFTKFTSKSEHGTGLGLFISRSIIEAHGGRIWGENNPEGGATFSFALPIAG